MLRPESAVSTLGIEPDVARYSLQPLYEDDGQEWRSSCASALRDSGVRSLHGPTPVCAVHLLEQLGPSSNSGKRQGHG
jgi:hypothetical protein